MRVRVRVRVRVRENRSAVPLRGRTWLGFGFGRRGWPHREAELREVGVPHALGQRVQVDEERHLVRVRVRVRVRAKG